VKFLNSHKKEYGIKSITVSGYNPATKVGTKFQDVDYSKYDVVITNPPFSLFREFISKLMQYPKLKFLVIGPMNATNYKDFFKLYKDDKV
jgi:type I restriction-modification system DNA methylase subunit